MKVSVKMIRDVMDTEDKFIVMAIITQAIGKMTRRMDGVRKFISKAAKSKREIGLMANTKHEIENRSNLIFKAF